jgi:hypothetical protein
LIGGHARRTDGKKKFRFRVATGGLGTPVSVVPSVGTVPNQRHSKSFIWANPQQFSAKNKIWLKQNITEVLV